MLICFIIGLAGLLAYHLSKLLGVADDSVTISKMGSYFAARGANLLFAALVYGGLFYAAFEGELKLMGFAGGVEMKGSYFLLGYMSQSLMAHWVKAKWDGIEKRDGNGAAQP